MTLLRQVRFAALLGSFIGTAAFLLWQLAKSREWSRPEAMQPNTAHSPKTPSDPTPSRNPPSSERFSPRTLSPYESLLNRVLPPIGKGQPFTQDELRVLRDSMLPRSPTTLRPKEGREEDGPVVLVLHGRVFIVEESYVAEHPGGSQILRRMHESIGRPPLDGMSADEHFDAVQHSEEALRKLAGYHVGYIVGAV